MIRSPTPMHHILALVAVQLGCATLSTTAADAAQAPSQAIAHEAPLDAAKSAEIVRNIAAAAEASYVDLTAGARLAGHLRQRLASRAYERISDPAELATLLTADMRSVVDDVHLRVVHEPDRSAEAQVPRMIVASGAASAQGRAAPGPQAFARIDGRSRAAIARSNYGFERVERLPGNVGYLKLSRFVPLDFSAATAEAALAFLANADAIIIDLRGVPGGSPDLVRLLLSYFTGPEPRRLMTVYNRPGDTIEETWTLAEVSGQRLTGRPLFVLQNRDSASAAEMLAYGVQRLGLGRVVGETSAGAGNGGNMLAVGSGLSLFLPQRRIVDGPGWEGTGVRPDVEAGSDDALMVAHASALEQLIAQTRDPTERREWQQARERLRNAPSSTMRSTLPTT